MVLGRITHYVVDAVLLSTVIAGVKRSSGFTSVGRTRTENPTLTLFRPDASKITDPTARSIAEKFLAVGETVFDMVQGTVVNSSYFKRST